MKDIAHTKSRRRAWQRASMLLIVAGAASEALRYYVLVSDFSELVKTVCVWFPSALFTAGALAALLSWPKEEAKETSYEREDRLARLEAKKRGGRPDNYLPAHYRALVNDAFEAGAENLPLFERRELLGVVEAAPSAGTRGHLYAPRAAGEPIALIEGRCSPNTAATQNLS
ncbi:hypothetical protein BX589_10174 [Paraburkholderia fungorum]|uniref:hypothetical protein n=1 Tax=Paraburkholderia fungorum TaxID=134537 RepID=UPI000D42FCB8|nr:hypothetical protein [Paraburkholderia fungorum]PRZ56424.1 hypothetical protein BX589_10174 [Paraburkholderia fungorum]